MCFWSFGRVCHTHNFELVLEQVWGDKDWDSASLYTDVKVNLKEKTEPAGRVGKSLSDTAPTPIYWEKCWSWAFKSSFYNFKSSYKKISHLLFHLFHITVLGHKRVGIMSFMWNFLKVAQLQGVRGLEIRFLTLHVNRDHREYLKRAIVWISTGQSDFVYLELSPNISIFQKVLIDFNIQSRWEPLH